MTDAPAAGAAAPIRTASLDLARSVLMGVGAVPFVAGIASGQQWQAIVGGLIAVMSAVWSYVAAHPARTAPIAALLTLAGRGGAAGAWNGDVEALAAALTPKLEALVDAQVKARLGLLAGPLDVAANAAVAGVVNTAAGAFLYPQT